MENIYVEATVFQWIAIVIGAIPVGYVALLVTTFIGQLIADMVWKFVDEGSSKLPDIFRKVLDTTYKPVSQELPEVEVHLEHGLTHTFVCKNVKTGEYLSNSSYKLWTDSPSIASTTYQYDKEDALEAFSNYYAKKVADDMEVTWVFIALLLCCGSSIAMYFLPIATMIGGSVMLSLFAMRWGRRGHKRSKAVQEMLDKHVADKDAHK